MECFIRRRFIVLFVVVFLLTTVSRLSRASAAEPDVKLELESAKGEKSRRVLATAILSASVERVWAALTRYEDYGLNNAFLEVKRVENIVAGEGAEVALKIGFPKPLPKLSCVLRFSEEKDAYRISLLREQGCFERTSGVISISRNNTGTFASLQLDFEPGMFFPDWALRWGMERIIPTEIARIDRAASGPAFQRTSNRVSALPSQSL